MLLEKNLSYSLGAKQSKIREDQCNPRHPRSMIFMVLACSGHGHINFGFIS